ncbi:MAG TPA: GNAT family N-acetyltransferase [Kribbellaceae bacterium]
MPDLVVPTTAVHRSFLAAWDELDESEDRWMGAHAHSPDESWTRSQAADPAEFARMVAAIRRDADPAAPMPADIVHQTVLWWVDGDEWLGRLSIRHVLNRFLLEIGGHIGYVVRPSARGRGHATAMLAASLPVAARLGIEQALVTCDTDNVASRKVIQACGGVFEDQRDNKLRFWIPTRPPTG